MATESSSPPAISSWDAGKLFVGGISWGTTDAALRDYFGKYGQVVETITVRDRETGNPRGFAFVIFADSDAAEKAINDKDHVILDRQVEVKRARSRDRPHQNPSPQDNRRQSRSLTRTNSNRTHARSKKIFVGGLSPEVDQDSFRVYFEHFGTVTDAVVIYDNLTRRSRGFGFIEFQLEESVDKVMEKGAHELDNKRVEVKIAVPKDGYNNRNTGGNNGNHSQRTGAGMGYGYYQGGMYPIHDPRNGMHPVYAPPPFSGYPYGPAGYGGGYVTGPYGRVGYGTPFMGSMSNSNGQGVGSVRQYPVPYGSAMYPGQYDGGYGGYYGMAGGGYYGAMSGTDKQGEAGSDVRSTPGSEMLATGVKSLKLDAR